MQKCIFTPISPASLPSIQVLHSPNQSPFIHYSPHGLPQPTAWSLGLPLSTQPMYLNHYSNTRIGCREENEEGESIAIFFQVGGASEWPACRASAVTYDPELQTFIIFMPLVHSFIPLHPILENTLSLNTLRDFLWAKHPLRLSGFSFIGQRSRSLWPHICPILVSAKSQTPRGNFITSGTSTLLDSWLNCWKNKSGGTCSVGRSIQIWSYNCSSKNNL